MLSKIEKAYESTFGTLIITTLLILVILIILIIIGLITQNSNLLNILGIILIVDLASFTLLLTVYSRLSR